MCECVVVGGGGFIGSHLIPLLSSSGRKRIVVVGRRPVPRFSIPQFVQYLQADADDPFFLDKILEDCSEVIDLAYSTVPSTSFYDPVLDIVGNIPASVLLLKAATARKLRKILIVSSGGTVYGNPKYLPIDESHPTNPISPYGITKLAIEKYAFMFYSLFGLPIVIVRPSNPYGENQFGNDQGFVGTAIFSILKNQQIVIYGNRGTVRDYLHIEDLCNGIVSALDHGKPGETYNIGTGIGMDNETVLDVTSELVPDCCKPLKVVRKPARPFDVEANVLSSAKLTYVSGWKCNIDFLDGFLRTWRWAVQYKLTNVKE